MSSTSAAVACTTYVEARDILSLVGRHLSSWTWDQWSMGEREAALDWATASYLRASDNYVAVPPLPVCVSALPMLGGRS